MGKGSYGAAILVHLRSNKNETFVIKEIVIGHMKEEERVSTMNEVEVLRQMHHSNIAMYVESFIEGSRLYIVMEHADGGDLSGAITRRKEGGKPWPENEVMRMFVQICLALKHVHEVCKCAHTGLFHFYQHYFTITLLLCFYLLAKHPPP